MARAARVGSITVEISTAAREHLRRLKRDLADLDARDYEIVGVLIKRASASAVSATALRTYRSEIDADREQAAITAVCLFIAHYGRG
jgi:hypothetical protein